MSRCKSIKPKVLDIFCGAGGMSLGFRAAGCIILGGIDSNEHAIKTHHRNFPESKFKLPSQDIRDTTNLSLLGIEPSEVDILIGGPPCQGFSRVGIGKMRRLGINLEEDQRNFLYREFVRFLNYYKPPLFVMENVDNLGNKSKEDVLFKILRELSYGIPGESIDYPNYQVNYIVLDASKFGVPQFRKRLFIIGARVDLCINPPVYEIGVNTIREPVFVAQAIADLPELEANSIPLRTKTSGPKQIDVELAYRCQPESNYQKLMREKILTDQGVMNHICRSHNEKDLEIFSILRQGEKYSDLPKEFKRYRNDIFLDKYKRLKSDKPSWTLTAHMRKDCLAYIHPTQNRSISVREAARLQSFPDDFVFDAPMTRMFELVGNSVPPLLARAVAEPVVKLAQLYKEQKAVQLSLLSWV